MITKVICWNDFFQERMWDCRFSFSEQWPPKRKQQERPKPRCDAVMPNNTLDLSTMALIILEAARDNSFRPNLSYGSLNKLNRLNTLSWTNDLTNEWIDKVIKLNWTELYFNFCVIKCRVIKKIKITGVFQLKLDEFITVIADFPLVINQKINWQLQPSAFFN